MRADELIESRLAQKLIKRESFRPQQPRNADTLLESGTGLQAKNGAAHTRGVERKEIRMALIGQVNGATTPVINTRGKKRPPNMRA